MEKLQLQLKHYQDALEKSNQQAMVEKMEKTTMEIELKTEARLLEQQNTENRFTIKKLCGFSKTLTKENDELKNKLELEHNRTVRAQTEIEEIKKEKDFLQHYLEFNHNECSTKSQENEEVKKGLEFKVSKFTEEIERLEAELEQGFNPEKDRMIFDLHSDNAKLY